MSEAAHGSTRSSLIAVGLCAFAYLYVFPYQSRLNNPNENVRFYMTAAIVDEGRYEIDGMRARWGWVNDAATHAGHVYSVKAPGASLLAVPGYALYRGLTSIASRPFDRIEALWASRLFATILPTLLWLFALHRWLCRRGHHAVLRDAVFFSIALGSLLYGYGMLLVSHTQSALAAFAAFMLLADVRERRVAPSWWRALLAGLLAGGVTLFEYPGLPCSIVLTVYALYVLWPAGRVRAVAAYVGGGLLPALAMMHFQWRAFGSPFTPGHLLMENEAFRAVHHRGMYGAVGPSLDALRGLLTDLGAGLFPLTPVLLLAPVGIVLLLRERARRAEGACIAGVVVLTVLVISSMDNWRGGWTIGPRYLALCVPFAAYAALIALERWAERQPMLALAFAIGAAAAGMIASGLPSMYYPHLPPELTRPLPQLIAVLIAHGYAPPNAGALLGTYASASMLPLLLAMLAALALCLRPVADFRGRALIALSSVAIAFALTLPLWQRPASERGVADAVAFVTRRWMPEGHDAAARSSAALRAHGTPPQAQLERLARLYEAEGREREARRARRGQL